MINNKNEKSKKGKPVSKKVYVIIDKQKHYIDSEIIKKYGLEKEEVTCMTGRKLYIEKD